MPFDTLIVNLIQEHSLLLKSQGLVVDYEVVIDLDLILPSLVDALDSNNFNLLHGWIVSQGGRKVKPYC
jgi:hypothetical protein